MASNRLGGLLSFVCIAALVGACGDDDGTNAVATLTIVAPTNAQVVTIADDEDAATAGIQFDVQVRATNLPDTDVIEILLDDEVATSTMPAGTALIEVPVTLPPGE
ncbi:MAG: hypothetical protein IT379_13260, partial [Deltaproteobacteria bacterium]|nr:hypothetical protein [Deltaproteobacteria bacterium]